MKNEALLVKAMKLAIKSHNDTNHTYDDVPYSVHLALAAHYAEHYIMLLPEEVRENVLSAVWLHDTIEDCRLTYNDLKNVVGEEVAQLVYAVTNEKGRTRAERANDVYYKGICETSYAVYVKLCDRLANVQYANVFNNVRMREIYRSENEHFLQRLQGDCLDLCWPMVENLKNMLQ